MQCIMGESQGRYASETHDIAQHNLKVKNNNETDILLQILKNKDRCRGAFFTLRGHFKIGGGGNQICLKSA